MKKKEAESVSKEMVDLAIEFLQAIFDDDIDRYWDTICKEDKARLYGMYRQYSGEHDRVLTFREYIKKIKLEHAEQYEGLRDCSPGMAQTLRYTEEGDVELRLHPNVKVPRTYIAPTEVLIYPLILTLDVEYIMGKIGIKYKVRLYKDKFHQNLEEASKEEANR
ncbi:hypothetical protein P4K96_29055 [Bacillus cereus]|uniref:hypothetical protein n=1 Tax=Paenibacillus melissococcoides TaxID=2912268 RepID=UPI002DC0C599|nr:hypothetical protein [Bacillus cereus]